MSPRWMTRADASHSHDPIELEHRLTTLHGDVKSLEEENDEHRERHDKLSRRMSLLEKAIVGILMVLQVLLQDKWPVLAALLKELRP